MRRYEINGYFLKTEITAQRLHSIVISALRGYRHARALRGGTASLPARRRRCRTTPARVARAPAAELAGLDERDVVLMQAQPEGGVGPSVR